MQMKKKSVFRYNAQNLTSFLVQKHLKTLVLLDAPKMDIVSMWTLRSVSNKIF